MSKKERMKFFMMPLIICAIVYVPAIIAEISLRWEGLSCFFEKIYSGLRFFENNLVWGAYIFFLLVLICVVLIKTLFCTMPGIVYFCVLVVYTIITGMVSMKKKKLTAKFSIVWFLLCAYCVVFYNVFEKWYSRWCDIFMGV